MSPAVRSRISVLLRAVKTGPASATLGVPYGYNLTAANAGGGGSGAMTVTDTLPAGFVVQSVAAGAQWTCSTGGQTVTCTRATPLGSGISVPVATITGVVNGCSASSLSNSGTDSNPRTTPQTSSPRPSVAPTSAARKRARPQQKWLRPRATASVSRTTVPSLRRALSPLPTTCRTASQSAASLRVRAGTATPLPSSSPVHRPRRLRTAQARWWPPSTGRRPSVAALARRRRQSPTRVTPNAGNNTSNSVVTQLNSCPTAVNDSATVAEDSGATAINVLANDTDPDGGPISITSVTQPANGTVVITGGGTGLTYQPSPDYCNTPPGTTLDTFTSTEPRTSLLRPASASALTIPLELQTRRISGSKSASIP